MQTRTYTHTRRRNRVSNDDDGNARIIYRTAGEQCANHHKSAAIAESADVIWQRRPPG